MTLMGEILHHSVPPRETLNTIYYCTFLNHHLRPELSRKRRHLVVQILIILYENVKSHTVDAVKDLSSQWHL